MIRRPMHLHVGLDHTGERHVRQKSAAESRRAAERHRLQPKLVLLVATSPGRAVWRNGLHRRRWLVLLAQTQGDRRCFLMTLKRAPLVVPFRAF